VNTVQVFFFFVFTQARGFGYAALSLLHGLVEMPKQLIYFADPMCSWCWGFSPVIDAIQETWGEDLPVLLVLGGLQPGNTKPLNDKAKDSIKEHWEHVHERSDQPFDHRFFERDGFVYDTEPPSRAIVALHSLANDGSLQALKTVHHAFYARNRDVTDPAVLADIAGELGHDREAFLTAFASDDAQAATQRGFEFSRNIRVTGFPTLLAGDKETGFRVLTQGYQSLDELRPTLEAYMAEAEAPETSP
jgi:putative protein-disulfide isomerase